MTGRAISFEAPQSIGLPFAYYLQTPTVRTHRDAVMVTLKALPDPFEGTVDAFDTPSWRLLHYAGRLTWALGCDPSWDPRPDMTALAATGAERVPATLIGDDPVNAASSLVRDLRTTDLDVGRACWLVLGFIQSLKLPPHEVRSIKWWEPTVWRHALNGFLPL